MGNFNRDNRRSGGGFKRGFERNQSFGGNHRVGARDGARSSMHQATCSECGQDCEIPFKPSNGRPVFCSKCFEKQNGGSRQSNFGSDRPNRFGFDDKKTYQAVCDKCGQDCQLPFRPTAGKPVFCDNCFGKGAHDKGFKNNNDSANSTEVIKEIKMLNNKIDQLIKILTPNAPVEKVAKSAKAEKKVETTQEVKPLAKEKTKTKVTVKKVSAKKKK